MEKLLKKFLSGDKSALSRLLTIVENERKEAVIFMKEIYPYIGKAFKIGITGPPGAGKSTLVNVLALSFKKKGYKVGIIAVDPTSPFTGGALLGDRIRMNKALAQAGIFMRSMASRGGVGGLAKTTHEAIDLFDAFGFDVILVETVGVGQLELDVAECVDVTLVVLVPETGGNVQAMKSGLIEIADIFVVNKSDREGAEKLGRDLEESMNLLPSSSPWKVPVVKTVAIRGEGVEELISYIEKYRDFLQREGLIDKKRLIQRKRKILNVIRDRLAHMLWENPKFATFLEHLSNLCLSGKLDPYTAADIFLKRTRVAGVEFKEL